jgi:hypothetical protein
MNPKRLEKTPPRLEEVMLEAGPARPDAANNCCRRLIFSVSLSDGMLTDKS